MKLRRRHVFLYVVIISVFSLFIVYQSFDKYARNSSITNRNKHLIEANLNDADKKKLIDENIHVDLFLPYIKETGFSLNNYEYYNVIAKYNRKLDKASVVSKGNILVAEDFTLKSLNELFAKKVYSLDQLITLSTTKSPFYPDAKPEFYPNRALALSNSNYFITNYRPNDLKTINKDFTANGKSLLLRNEANKQLTLLCDNLTLLTDEKCGGLQIDYAYLSYDYVADGNNKKPFFIKPGHNDFQLGNTISFTNSQKFNENNLYLWMIDNAHKYGFIQRYPNDKVEFTKVNNEYGVFRYVGLDYAKTFYENKNSIEEKNKKEWGD